MHAKVECYTDVDSSFQILSYTSSSHVCVNESVYSNNNNEYYIPNSSSPIKILRLNLHIIQKSDGTGNFTNSQQHIQYLEWMFDKLNDLFSNQQEPLWGGVTGDPYISDTRLRFELQSIYFHQDDIGYTNNNQTCDNSHYNFITDYHLLKKLEHKVITNFLSLINSLYNENKKGLFALILFTFCSIVLSAQSIEVLIKKY